MEQGAAFKETDERSRLLEAARALVLRGEPKFSIAALCAEADVPRIVFRTHFSGKTQLMAALMAEAQGPAPSSISGSAPVPATASAPEPVKPDESTPKAALGPSVSTPDAWLERRLRVFERALTALEVKAEAANREQARVIADLEQKLAQFEPAAQDRRLARRPVTIQAAAPAAMAEPGPLAAAHVAPLEDYLEVKEAASAESAQPEAPKSEEDKPSALLEIAPAPVVSLSREEIAEVVQLARGKARAVIAEPAPQKHSGARVRLLAIGALALLVLLLCVGLSLGRGALTTGASAAEDDGVAHRQTAQSALARTTALADAGDARAQAKLALIYLKGEGVKADPAAALRWSRAAAEGGQPVAQYLMGSFYREDTALTRGLVPADAAAAFRWFEAAAVKGNLKAMHNLAIAYAEGLGTDKDEKKAAEWFTRAAERGYVDSAFDLAVLYERGLGVTQDLKQALTWYGIAARMGDAPAEERITVLRGQISQQAVALAAAAAENFTPVPPLVEANRL